MQNTDGFKLKWPRAFDRQHQLLFASKWCNKSFKAYCIDAIEWHRMQWRVTCKVLRQVTLVGNKLLPSHVDLRSTLKSPTNHQAVLFNVLFAIAALQCFCFTHKHKANSNFEIASSAGTRILWTYCPLASRFFYFATTLLADHIVAAFCLNNAIVHCHAMVGVCWQNSRACMFGLQTLKQMRLCAIPYIEHVIEIRLSIAID